jgi:signal transduction histidine kinase
MKLSDFIKDVDKSTSSSESSSSDLEVILDILKRLNSSLILPNVLELVLKSAIQITKSERGFIVLKNEKDKLEFVLCLDANGKPLPEKLFEISTSVVNEVFSTEQAKFIESALDDTTNASQSIINLELQTIMCAPLITEGNKIGVLYVDSRFLNKIKSNEITRTFEILTSQAGIAINNALMHERQLQVNNELKKAYQELEIAKQESERLEILKNHFLLQMSHEIRTPFNIILGSVELLKLENNSMYSKEMIQLFNMLEQGSNRIIRTVDGIMEMSRIRSGSYKINKETVKLEDSVIKGVILSYKNNAEEKGILLTYEKTTAMDEVRCDKFMIYQIIQELVDNAVKFTQKGIIKIKQFKNNDNKLCVSVSDTGVGISQEYLQHIFEPFTQEDTGYSRKFEGNGLALAIVKKYADMNNLVLEVKSEKKIGSEFKVIFN